MRNRKPRRKVAAPGAQTLVILAGLPPVVAEAAAARVSQVSSNLKAVSVPFSVNESAAFYSDKTIRDLMLQACFFAEAEDRRATAIASPNRILLLFAGLPGFERLCEAFGFAVMPIQLEAEGEEWRNGRHWRFDLMVTMAAITRAIETASKGALMEIHGTLLRNGADEILRLPGRNFHLPNGSRLADRFGLLLSGRIDVEAVREGVEVRVFTRSDLAAYYRRVGGDRMRFCVDDRALVFCSSPQGMHGSSRILGEGDRESIAMLRTFLEGQYRFGTPLRSGFQHDVQRDRDRRLDHVAFDCSNAGPVQISGTHANVYPNDVVRPP